MCEAADERELVVAVVLGPDDYARIALGGCRESAVCVRELREKCVVIHIADVHRYRRESVRAAQSSLVRPSRARRGTSPTRRGSHR